MTGRERIEAAFSTQGAPELGVVLCYQGIYIRDHYREFDRHPWWYLHSPSTRQWLEKVGEILERTETDWFSIGPCEAGADRAVRRIEERAGQPWLVDSNTGGEQALDEPVIGGWGKKEHYGLAFEADTLPTNEAELDAQVPVDAPLDADMFLNAGRQDQAAKFQQRFPAVFPVGGTVSLLWSLYGVWGFEGLMLMAAQQPALLQRALRRRLQYALNRVKQAALCGCRAVWIEECMTDQISPAAFLKMNVPLMKDVCAAIHDEGMRSIYYYCGNPWDRMDAIMDVGADAVSFEESKKGFSIDIEDVVDAADGRCVVLGNLDAIGVLEQGSDDELAAEIERQIRAGRRNGRRFIMSIGSPVTPGTSVERVRDYCRIAHRLGATV